MITHVVFLAVGVILLVAARVAYRREIRRVRRHRLDARTWLLVLVLLGTMFGPTGILVGVLGLLSDAQGRPGAAALGSAVLLLLGIVVGVDGVLRERRAAAHARRPIRRWVVVPLGAAAAALVVVATLSLLLP